MADYKQASITPQTAEKIAEIKKKLADKGTPMQAPAIIGEAVNQFAKKV